MSVVGRKLFSGSKKVKKQGGNSKTEMEGVGAQDPGARGSRTSTIMSTVSIRVILSDQGCARIPGYSDTRIPDRNCHCPILFFRFQLPVPVNDFLKF